MMGAFQIVDVCALIHTVPFHINNTASDVPDNNSKKEKNEIILTHWNKDFIQSVVLLKRLQQILCVNLFSFLYE